MTTAGAAANWDNNDGPPDLDEIFRLLNQSSRLLGGRGGQGGGSPDGGRALFKGGASLLALILAAYGWFPVLRGGRPRSGRGAAHGQFLTAYPTWPAMARAVSV